MKVLAIFAIVCLAVASASNYYLEANWVAFKQKHSKVYRHSTEEVHRKNVFSANLDYILQHNNEAAMGVHTFTLGVNEYTDLTSEEFAGMVNGYDHLAGESSLRGAEQHVNVGETAATVDWRTKGYVTAVKNQGQCGSCWSFSATGSLEGLHFKMNKTLVVLSEQQLVDCDKMSHGCGGGLMGNAFTYVKAKGSELEKTYPYEAKNGDCRYMESKVVASCGGFKRVGRGNEKDLAHAISSQGPISVAIDASRPTFQMYSSGVYYDPKCSSTMLDHGVLAVGYGSDYYIVKNSWGASWGDQGYIKMARNKKNNCGIATQASYPTA